MKVLPHKFTIGSFANVDGARDIRVIITAVLWRGGPRIEYEVQWFANSQLWTAWVDEGRLTLEPTS